MTLVDSSVWIACLRRPELKTLDRWVPFEQVVTCLPVIQEVLQGLARERDYRIAHDALFALPIVEAPLAESVFVEAVGLYRTARRSGRTIRSSFDCLIAVCALRHDLEVLHADRDYKALARISGLRERSVRI